MRLYHLSPDVWGESLTRNFLPRVPACTMSGENCAIPRVCFSKSVLGCINAIPKSHWNVSSWDRGLWDSVWSSDWDSVARGNAVLYSIDSEDLAPGSFMDSLELYEQGLVPDALATQECWCLEPVQMTGKIVDIQIRSDSRDAVLFSTKERNRESIYSLINHFCDGFATKHKDTLDELSLFYIINDYMRRQDIFSKEAVDGLEDAFSWLSTSSIFMDKHLVYADCEINGRRLWLDEHLDLAWKRPGRDFLLEDPGRAGLDELIFDAMVEETVSRAGKRESREKDPEPGPEWAVL